MATDTGTEKIISTTGNAAAGGSTVHHREFPEIRAEGTNPAEAATHLVTQLTKALDCAPIGYQRDAIHRAIAEAQAFATHPS